MVLPIYLNLIIGENQVRFSSPQKFLDLIKQFLQDQRTQMISFSLSFRDPERKKRIKTRKGDS